MIPKTLKEAFTPIRYSHLKNKFLIILSVISLTACRRVKETPAPEPSYYPLAIGEFSIFAIEELTHDPFREQTDTSRYWLRETIVDTLRDNSGRLVYKIEQETSRDTSTSWAFESYGLTHTDEFNAQRFINDVRTVVLSFPLRERKSWDVNELNSQDNKTARYFDIDQAVTVSGQEYSNTLRVDLGNDVDPLFQEIEEEIYARGVGLIKRIKINVETQPDKYKEGNEFTQTIIRTNR